MNSPQTVSHKKEVSPVEKIINEVTEKLTREMKEFFSVREADIGTAERYFGSRIAGGASAHP